MYHKHLKRLRRWEGECGERHGWCVEEKQGPGRTQEGCLPRPAATTVQTKQGDTEDTELTHERTKVVMQHGASNPIDWHDIVMFNLFVLKKVLKYFQIP